MGFFDRLMLLKCTSEVTSPLAVSGEGGAVLRNLDRKVYVRKTAVATSVYAYSLGQVACMKDLVEQGGIDYVWIGLLGRVAGEEV